MREVVSYAIIDFFRFYVQLSILIFSLALTASFNWCVSGGGGSLGICGIIQWEC